MVDFYDQQQEKTASGKQKVAEKDLNMRLHICFGCGFSWPQLKLCY